MLNRKHAYKSGLALLMSVACQGQPADAHPNEEPQPTAQDCSDCTVESCPGAAQMIDETLRIDQKQLRHRSKCLGVHAEVRLQPKGTGVSLTGIREESLFHAMGLENRDVLVQINGSPVDMEVLGRFNREFSGEKENNPVELTVKRNDQLLTLRFRVQ